MPVFRGLVVAGLGVLAACNDYIVVFNSSAAAQDRAQHLLAFAASASVTHEYAIGAFAGYAATMDESLVQELRDRPEVAYVERSIPIYQHAAKTCQTEANAPSWGLQRVSAAKQPLDGTYKYAEGAGADTDIYVIDAGVRVTHKEFEGRARFGANVVKNPPGHITTDPDGHGTHCAGVAASKTYGICKQCNVVSVIVFDDNHRTDSPTIIAGLQWVLDSHKRGNASRKSVISISLGGEAGETSDAMDAAVGALTDAGVHVVTSAGNYNGDACENSPARAKKGIDVSAISNEFPGQDFWSPAANSGKCVDILAPGDNIISLGHNSDTEVGVSMTGTSMATPHVAGVVGILSSLNPAMSLGEVQNLLMSNAEHGDVELLPADTTNKILHSSCKSSEALVV